MLRSFRTVFRHPHTSKFYPISKAYLSTSSRLNMKVVPVPVRSDNYAYLLIDDATSEAAAVDIFDVPKVVGKANELGVRITSLLTTHCHLDHGGGNKDFADQFPDVPIYGGSGKVRAVTKIVQEGDILKVGDNITVKCLATPCHTRDSICYYVEDVTRSQRGVFTGDTLFVAGCGKFFEGTAEEMHNALSRLVLLPSDTITYVGHEYTADNLKFAASIDPENSDIQGHIKFCAENEVTTGKTTIGDEKKFNVFVRLGDVAVRHATLAKTDIEAMDKLRTMKNEFA